MQFSVSLDTMFPATVTLDQLKKLSQMGYRFVEYSSFPQEEPALLRDLLDQAELRCYALGMPDTSLVDPNLQGQFLEQLKSALSASQIMGNRLVVCGVGMATEQSHESQLESIVTGLELSLPLLDSYGCSLLLEMRNSRIDYKGYALNRTGDAAAVLKLLNSPQVRMLYNMYHQQISEGNIMMRLEKYLPLIGHIRAAGIPGRGELDTGELAYPHIFSFLDSIGYRGKIGLDYTPTKPPFEGLAYCMQLEEQV